MARQASETGASRERLSRERVVAVALAIVDRDGLEQLTMRSLGRELGVDSMAAYHWFPNKLAILQGVGEAILAEIQPPSPDPGVPWQTTARALAREYRAALLRHSNALPVAATQPVMTPRGLSLIERTAAALVAGGLAPAAAIEAINTAASLVIGSAMVDGGVTPGTEPVDQQAIHAVYADLDPVAFPTISAAMAVTIADLDVPEGQFETALDALVRGLEASFADRGLLRT